MKLMIATLIQPFIMVWDSIFNNDAHEIISKAGMQELRKQILIDMMEQDEKLGLYKTTNLRMIDDFEKEQYEYAAALSKCDNKEERQKMIERVEVLIRYRGAMAQQILIHMNYNDEDLVKMLKHMYTHYDDLIKESLGL
jgi:hypothetical protein